MEELHIKNAAIFHKNKNFDIKLTLKMKSAISPALNSKGMTVLKRFWIFPQQTKFRKQIVLPWNSYHWLSQCCWVRLIRILNKSGKCFESTAGPALTLFVDINLQIACLQYLHIKESTNDFWNTMHKIYPTTWQISLKKGVHRNHTCASPRSWSTHLNQSENHLNVEGRSLTRLKDWRSAACYQRKVCHFHQKIKLWKSDLNIMRPKNDL